MHRDVVLFFFVQSSFFSFTIVKKFNSFIPKIIIHFPTFSFVFIKIHKNYSFFKCLFDLFFKIFRKICSFSEKKNYFIRNRSWMIKMVQKILNISFFRSFYNTVVFLILWTIQVVIVQHSFLLWTTPPVTIYFVHKNDAYL